MTILKSRINIDSDDFKMNYSHNKNLYSYYQDTLHKVLNGKSHKAEEKLKSRGKLPVRERIKLLIDENSKFYEFSSLAAFDQYDNQFPGAGIVTGVGKINDFDAIIVANDPTAKGGTYVHETIKKHLRAQEIALQNNTPIIYIVDSGGIYLPEQSKVYPDKDHFGRIFYNQARLSAEQIPQIAIVMGSCTAGGAYIPAMSDESIIVKDNGSVYLAGPPLVKAAIGEDISVNDLGGAIVHTSISGVVDHLADNEMHALEICRDIFSNLNIKPKQFLQKHDIEEPLYPIDELFGIVSSNLKRSFNIYEVIARLVDGSRFQEFKSNYGKSIVTGFAKLKGYSVGILANNGVLFSESALKATHFIELCCYRKIPIIFLQNIVGFMVGKEAEHKGIAKDGAKMIHAVANSNVPKFSIIIGGSYGAGNYAMAGRAFQPNLLFQWPNAKISVMGGEQASEVLLSISKNGNNKYIKRLRESFEHESQALYSTSRIWDDGIINPAETRDYLAMGISLSLNKPIQDPKMGVYRM